MINNTIHNTRIHIKTETRNLVTGHEIKHVFCWNKPNCDDDGNNNIGCTNDNNKNTLKFRVICTFTKSTYYHVLFHVLDLVLWTRTCGLFM